jgi:hypothetical protein
MLAIPPHDASSPDEAVGVRPPDTRYRWQSSDDRLIYSKWLIAMSMIYPAILLLLLGVDLALQALHLF